MTGRIWSRLKTIDWGIVGIIAFFVVGLVSAGVFGAAVGHGIMEQQRINAQHGKPCEVHWQTDSGRCYRRRNTYASTD